jgi:hypothetical protein
VIWFMMRPARALFEDAVTSWWRAQDAS